MRYLTTKIILAAACAIFSSGCMSVHREAEHIHLSRHPTHETRMTNQPAEGYVLSGVWRIRGAQNTVYLAATSHLVAEDQIPFPSPFYAAYQDSKEIYVECDTDFSPFGKVGLVFKLLRWLKSHQAEIVCSKGRNLASYLSTGTVQRLREFYGKDYPKMERMTPLFLVWMAEMTDKGNADNGGVEDVFTLLARKDGKPIRELDDKAIVDTALTVFDEMLLKFRAEIARRGADAVVEKYVFNNEDDIDDSVWRQGDWAAAKDELAEMKSEMPLVYEKLLPERNRKWVSRLKVVLQGKRNVMVLVGAAHIGGKDGLLELLQEAGFTAEQMYGVDRPALKTQLEPKGSSLTRR